MNAFSEQCDSILRYLLENNNTTWYEFTKGTGLVKDDPLLTFLKKHKSLIDYTDKDISLTLKGVDFISSTSFVKERKGV